MRVYGPYTGKDNRLRCIIVHDDGRKQIVGYPRMLMERKLGRPLTEEKDVHHIDENPLNNSEELLKSLFQKHVNNRMWNNNGF